MNAQEGIASAVALSDESCRYQHPNEKNPRGFFYADAPGVRRGYANVREFTMSGLIAAKNLALLRRGAPADPTSDRGGCVPEPRTRKAQRFVSDYERGQHGSETRKQRKARQKKARVHHGRITTILVYLGRLIQGDEVKPRYATDDEIGGKAVVMRQSRDAGDVVGTIYYEVVSDATREIIENLLDIPMEQVWLEDLEDELLRAMGYWKETA